MSGRLLWFRHPLVGLLHNASRARATFAIDRSHHDILPTPPPYSSRRFLPAHALATPSKAEEHAHHQILTLAPAMDERMKAMREMRDKWPARRP